MKTEIKRRADLANSIKVKLCPNVIALNLELGDNSKLRDRSHIT